MAKTNQLEAAQMSESVESDRSKIPSVMDSNINSPCIANVNDFGSAMVRVPDVGSSNEATQESSVAKKPEISRTVAKPEEKKSQSQSQEICEMIPQNEGEKEEKRIDLFSDDQKETEKSSGQETQSAEEIPEKYSINPNMKKREKV